MGLSLIAVAGGALLLPSAIEYVQKKSPPLHFAVNLADEYASAAAVGFNLADVDSLAALEALPREMKAVYWLGNGYKKECSWEMSDERVAEIVTVTKKHPKFAGIYFIADTAHPSVCPEAPEQIAMRTSLIHSLDPAAKTFIIVKDGYIYPTEFRALKDSADYIGVDPFPCNVKYTGQGCDWTVLRSRVASARAAGIELNRIVPVFQAFGQHCSNVEQLYYRLPSVAETETLLALWDELVPVADRPFDMVYSWAPQPGSACPTLKDATGDEYPDLRRVYEQYFAQAGN